MSRPLFQSCWLKFLTAGFQIAVCVSLLAFTIQPHAAEPAAVKFGSPDDWVKPHFFTRPALDDLPDSSADEHLLLLERQINAVQNETFVHYARQILTLDGVQNGSTLTIDFNPDCQSLTWHWARIWRDGQHLDRLDTNSVKIVQREQELDQFALNGEKSAVLVLDDVRVGDVIDYAYSIKGTNPVFGGHFSAAALVQSAQPAERLLTEVFWPSSSRLYAKAHGCSVQPAVISGKGSVEYVWDFRQVPGLTLEDSLPLWCDPEPWVQLSDFQSWAQVNQWASVLFRTTSSLSPELTQKIAEWKQIPGQEQQILAALRFVQDEVRYFGIEIGESTEKPAAPSTVCARRFGDCKDKSLLFVTILRALGIEANPVLVNATSGRAILDWQPSAAAFDHCIAAVQCDGQTYWLDPTMNYQRGPLALHYLPDYGCGLVISPGTTGLTVIPQMAGWTGTTTSEYFQLHGKTEPADLKVVTVATGRDAEILRASFATNKRSDIEKQYTHYYSDLYPGVKMSLPIILVDDEQLNQVQTTEFYSIDKLFTALGKDRKYRCTFYPSAINNLLKKPVDTDRKLPLGITFPQHQVVRTEIILPDFWTVDTDKKTISDPAFIFQKNCSYTGRKLVMEYGYQSLADSISPDQVGQYLDDLNQCSQSLGYTLTWR